MLVIRWDGLQAFLFGVTAGGGGTRELFSWGLIQGREDYEFEEARVGEGQRVRLWPDKHDCSRQMTLGKLGEETATCHVCGQRGNGKNERTSVQYGTVTSLREAIDSC